MTVPGFIVGTGFRKDSDTAYLINTKDTRIFPRLAPGKIGPFGQPKFGSKSKIFFRFGALYLEQPLLAERCIPPVRYQIINYRLFGSFRSDSVERLDNEESHLIKWILQSFD